MIWINFEYYFSNMSKKSFNVYTFGQSDPNEKLAKKFFNSKTVELADIPLLKILSLSMRFSSVPELSSVTSVNELIKRKLIKVLNLTVEKDIERRCLEEMLFLEHGNMTLFCPGKIASEIYSIHCPQMKTLEVCSKFSSDTLKSAKMVVDQYRKIDLSGGTTVFVNPTSLDQLFMYRKLHPNKRVIIRIHDWIGSEDSVLRLVAMRLKQLQISGIINSIETYNKCDSVFFNALYRPNGANKCYLSSVDSKFRTALVAFLGVSN